MTTQTRPMMPLTVGMPASIRIRKNTPPTAPAVPEMPEIKLPPRGTTGPVHIIKTARTLAADHTPPGQEPAVGGIFQGRIKSMSNI